MIQNECCLSEGEGKGPLSVLPWIDERVTGTARVGLLHLRDLSRSMVPLNDLVIYMAGRKRGHRRDLNVTL